MTDDFTSPTGGTEFNLERRIGHLNVIADWRDKLNAELIRAEVMFELGLMTKQDIDALSDSVALCVDAMRKLEPKDPK